MSTSGPPESNADGDCQVDAVRGGRDCLKWYIACVTNGEDPCVPIPFEFDAEARVEEVTRKVVTHPSWGAKDILLMPCGEVNSQDANFALRVRDWVRRKIVYGNTTVPQPTQELRSVFPDGPPSVKKRSVVDFVATDTRFVAEVEERVRYIEECGWRKDDRSEYARIIGTFLDFDFGEVYKKDVVHIPLNEKTASEAGIDNLTRGSSHIYVRPAYRLLFERLELFEEVQGRPYSVKKCPGIVITGQPGSGKTTFLWFMFLCCIMKRYSIIFRTRVKHVLFDSGVAYVVNSPDPEVPRGTRWALIDVDNFHPEPVPEWIINQLPIIQTSCPNPAFFKWAAPPYGLLWGMPLWTRQELMKAASYHRAYDGYMTDLRQVIEERKALSAAEVEYAIAAANSDHESVVGNRAYRIAFRAAPYGVGGSAECVSTAERILDHVIDHQIRLWGPIARDVLTGIFDITGNKALYDWTIDALTIDAKTSFSQVLDLFHSWPRKGEDSFRTRIFKIAPPGTIASNLRSTAPNERWSYGISDKFQPDFKAAWIAERFARNFARIDLFKMKRAFDGVPDAATKQGWIFQKIAFSALSMSANLERLRVVGMVWVNGPTEFSDVAISKSSGGRSRLKMGQDETARGASIKSSPQKESGKAANIARRTKGKQEKRFDIPVQDRKARGASSTLSQKRSGGGPNTAGVTKKQRLNTAATKSKTQGTDPRPLSNHSMKSGAILVPPSGLVKEGFETVADASLSSDDEMNVVGAVGLKFSTPPDAEKDPSEDPSGMSIPFDLRDREICLVDSSCPFESTFTLDCLAARIFTPAALDHPLFDGFLVRFPDVCFVQVTERVNHGDSAKGVPIIQSILAKVQEIADKEGEKQTVRARYLLVKELPFRKRTWTLPGATAATDGDVCCLHIDMFGGGPFVPALNLV